MSFLQLLEADLRGLSAEARKNDGFSGFFAGHAFPEVKEAAEHAILKLRSLPLGSDPASCIAGCEVHSHAQRY